MPSKYGEAAQKSVARAMRERKARHTEGRIRKESDAKRPGHRNRSFRGARERREGQWNGRWKNKSAEPLGVVVTEGQSRHPSRRLPSAFPRLEREAPKRHCRLGAA